MIDIKKHITKFPENCLFTEDDLFSLVNNGELKRTTFRWALYNLVKEGYISKVGRKLYRKNSLKNFTYSFEVEEENISRLINKEFNNININIWSSTLLNKWFNLLIMKNLIFVECDKFYEKYIFDLLNEKYKGIVLLNPTVNEINKYSKDNTVIIKNKISKSPSNLKGNKITLEKLSVDLLFDKTLNNLYGSTELLNSFAKIINTYNIDFSKMITYADRRGKKVIFLNILDKELKNDSKRELLTKLY